MNEARDEPVAVQRDPLTWLVYGQLGLWGFFLFGFGPVVPILRDELEISNAVAGLHATMISAGSVTAALLYPWLARRLGRRTVGRLGMGGIAAGVALLCSVDALAVTLTGTFVAGGFGSLLVTGSAVILRERHDEAAPAAITEANAVAAAFGLAAPALIGAAILLDLGWRPVMLGVVGLALALALTLGREPVPDAARESADAREALGSRYRWAWLVVAVVIGLEASMTVWSSDLLRERAGLGEAGAAAGVSALLAGMLAGRLAGGRLARRYAAPALLLGALALAAAGFAAFWWASDPGAAIAGLTLTGLGMSLHYPLAITNAIDAGSRAPDRAAGRAALGVGGAAALSPLVVGALADATDIRTALLVVPALLATATIGVLAGERHRALHIATLDG